MNTQETFEIARFGVEAEKFINSPIGQYVIERAEMDREKAIEEFKKIDVADVAAVRRIQNDIDTPDRIVKWLTDAIQSGYAAHDALRQQEAEQ